MSHGPLAAGPSRPSEQTRRCCIRPALHGAWPKSIMSSVASPPSEQQTHSAALVIDNGQVAGGIGAKHDRAEELTATETIFPGTDLGLVLSPTGPS